MISVSIRMELGIKKIDLTHLNEWNSSSLLTCVEIQYVMVILRSKGWRNGQSTRLPPLWPGFKSQCRSLMWVEFVVGSLLSSK